MSKQEKIENAIRRLERALENIGKVVGEDNFNFIGSLTIFDKKQEVDDESRYWNIGDMDTSITSAECLLDEFKAERDNVFNYNLNLN